MTVLSWLVLDAMGVIYRACDDVAELLIPFLRNRGCVLEDEVIEDLYRSTSLGERSSAAFWSECGVSAVDTEYIVGHELNEGLHELVVAANSRNIRVACLSNDVSEWALLQRRHFGLEDLIDPWCISGDIGARKPDPMAYHVLLETLGVDAASCLFVDDRTKNVDAARSIGLQAVEFDAAPSGSLLTLESLLS